MNKDDIKKNIFLRLTQAAGKVFVSRAEQNEARKKKIRQDRRRKWIEEDLKQRGWKPVEHIDHDYDSNDWTY